MCTINELKYTFLCTIFGSFLSPEGGTHVAPPDHFTTRVVRVFVLFRKPGRRREAEVSS